MHVVFFAFYDLLKSIFLFLTTSKSKRTNTFQIGIVVFIKLRQQIDEIFHREYISNRTQHVC